MKIILSFIIVFVLSSSILRAETEVDLLSLYKELHANPELSFKEEQTSKKLATILRNSGFKVTENFGGFGVVALFKNGEGKTVMIRADMDGLPVEELTKASYASKKKSFNQVGDEVFTMHACGHDIHMTSLIGTAINLVKRKDDWKGNLLIILQPAEEVSGGARAMIKEGLFKKFPRPDFNLALHVNAQLPAGKVGYVPGWAMANVDSMDITVKGIGGHGAYPHTTKDPIVFSAQLINNIQTIISREISPLESAVVTVGSIHGGTKHNVIPSEVKLQLTLRSYTDETRNKIIQTIRRIANGLAKSYDLPKDLYPQIELKDEYTPALYNNPELTQKLKVSFEKAIGEENVLALAPVMGGEDFGMYGRVEPIIPSALFWLGAVNKKDYDKSIKDNLTLPSLHSPYFLPDPDPTITTGVNVMVTSAIDLFNNS